MIEKSNCRPWDEEFQTFRVVFESFFVQQLQHYNQQRTECHVSMGIGEDGAS